MPKVEKGSIVRSKVLDLLREEGLFTITQDLSKPSFEMRLLMQMRRELDSLSSTYPPDAQKCLLNASNLIDLVYAYAKLQNVTKGEINALRASLKKVEGTFDRGHFLINAKLLSAEERTKMDQEALIAASLAEKARSTRGGASALIEAGLVNSELIPKSTHWDMSDSQDEDDADEPV